MATVGQIVRYKLVFFVPNAALLACKSAIFSVGAGRFPTGDYSQCHWQTLGTGSFQPGDSANPHIGTRGKVEVVEEYRVETICVGEEVVTKAVAALKK
jgi:hypothetical protein